MTRLALTAALVASLSLGGCATRLTAGDVATLVKTFHEAGCGGAITVDIRGGTGQLGGSASGAFTANGDCPKAATPVAPAFVPLAPGVMGVPAAPVAPAPIG